MHELIETFGFIILLALVPFVLVLMTSFTRVSIILTFLKQALSTSVPSTQIIIGLSLILTGYIMHPVITEIHSQIRNVYEERKEDTNLASQSLEISEKAWPPLRSFMLSHTREKDLELLLTMNSSKEQLPTSIDEVPWYSIVPAFVLSELRCAFFLGFLLFLPFLIIDMVVTSLLMSMGMVMLPPVMISFPFKLLLFIVVDGWHLLVQQIVVGYQ
jgi:flagellar biosynthetic protein FliP